MDIAVLPNLQSTIGNAQSATKKLPMAGLEPARAYYGPTDFKSVASTISATSAHADLEIFTLKLAKPQPKPFRAKRARYTENKTYDCPNYIHMVLPLSEISGMLVRLNHIVRFIDTRTTASCDRL
jgi:hypothetical protein